MRIIGLISGTSVDGMDAALVELSGLTDDLQVTVLDGITVPYPPELRQKILAVCGGAVLSMADLADLDDAIAHQCAQAALSLQPDQPPAALIGSHGQTVFHRPARSGSLGYSLQLGRGDAIAHRTGIPTVSNFRAADIAANGQGAPLVPKIDAYLFGSDHQTCCVQNIGGIGNLTYLPKRHSAEWEQQILGWDTGPGNSLLDLAVHHLSDGAQTYDDRGNWAASGTPCIELVETWLQQPYFQQTPPKSTGRELFGAEYLQQCLADCAAHQISNPADILATLTELTAASIAHSYRTFLPHLPGRILIGGGGSKNHYLQQRIQAQVGTIPVSTTDAAGISADFKEAIAFAVLAYWRVHNIPGNLPSVTGASQPVLLGDVYE